MSRHDDVSAYARNIDRTLSGLAGQQSIALAAAGTTRQSCPGTPSGVLQRMDASISATPTEHNNSDELEPVGECTRQLPFPDYSKARPDTAIRAYRVNMHINYVPGDHPIIFRVTSAGKELRPWQAFASYEMTGSFVLYGHCAEGFVVSRVFGTRSAKPSHFDEPGSQSDMAAFDPESAAAAGIKDLHLGYTCVRSR